MMPLKTHLSNISHFSTSWQAASCRPELIGKDTMSWAGMLFPCGKHLGQAMLPVARVPVSPTESTMQPVKHWYGFLLLAMCHPCFDSWRAPINPTTKEEGVEGFLTALSWVPTPSPGLWHHCILVPIPLILSQGGNIASVSLLSLTLLLTHPDQLTACTYWPYTEIWESCAGSLTAPVCVSMDLPVAISPYFSSS